jgi:hypothetical protein
MPCKCLYALKSSLLFCGNMLFAWSITRSCILRIDLLLCVFSVEVLFCFVLQNDGHHVLMSLLMILGMFQCLVLGCLGVYLLPREKINMCVHFRRDHRIFSYLF